jgi:hypothetical protein
MYLDVQVRLPNNFWARHLVDAVAMWLKCNSTLPFRWIVGYPEYSRLRNGIRYDKSASRQQSNGHGFIYSLADT